MKKSTKDLKSKNTRFKTKAEKGAALVIVLMVMLLLMGFVAIVLSRANSETVITANDAAEGRSYSAAQALVESNSRDFASLFQRRLSPTNADIDTIRTTGVQGFDDYDFTRKFIVQKKVSQSIQIPDGDYAGLFSVRDEWEIDVTAKDKKTGVESRVKRSFNNDRIPLFQFGMFYEDDLELNRPPLFTFGGRVHTNANLFISASRIVETPPSGGIYFNSKATVVGEVVNDIWKFGAALAAGTDDQGGVKFADTSGTYRELMTGRASVKCVNPSGANVFFDRPNLPNCSARPDWYSTDKLPFQGNLDNHKPRLNLPLYRLGVNLIELVKRGANVGDRVGNGNNPTVAVTAATSDDPLLSYERFANKEGIRISLADAQNKLPGCATAAGPGPNNNACGVRLDLGIGYRPTAMRDGYQATRLNATRFAQSGGKEMWIKVEMVSFDFDNGVPVTTDITEDILSLGVTEAAPYTGNFQIAGYTQNGALSTTFEDSRSIIKLQRFTIPGPTIPNAAGAKYLSNRDIGGTNHNLVVRFSGVTPVPLNPTPGDPATNCNIALGAPIVTDIFSAPPPSPQYAANSNDERNNHSYCVRFGIGPLVSYTTVTTPIPIQLYDTREGVLQDRPGNFGGVNGTDSFGTNNVTRAGAMSMIDVDVANLRRFLMGDFNAVFPNTTPFATRVVPAQPLQNANVPQNKGWVVYVSDRRGDADFDGEYDMEDTIAGDGVQQFNEDVNGAGVFNPGNGVLERLFYDLNNNFFEAPRYNETLTKSQAATTDHGYYRRGVRLINGPVLPGSYDRLNPTQTLGFTFASENGVYVKGNYNATSVDLAAGNAPAPAENYQPQGGTPTQPGSANALNHIPAAIASDATTILSSAWNDSQSFAFPFAQESRVAAPTQIRFALLTGDIITGKNGTTANGFAPSATGGLGNGGVHNFKRFLEVWSNVRLNYTGSLVNLFNSRNNNGYFKCCEAVYNPPTRDWSFDTSFLDPNRLPPGTPYIYSMSFTGFQRISE